MPAPPSAPWLRPTRGRGRHQIHVYRHEERDGPAEFAKVEIIAPLPEIKRVNGEITYKDAIREALMEEMKRDRRVLFYGEDVADYGGAFKATKGLLEIVRARPRVQHADLRGLHLRHGHRAGDDRAASRDGIDVLRFRADVVRPDQQPGREMALHERRADRSAAGAARVGRRWQGLRRPAFADTRIHVLPHPRPLRRLSGDALRREGHVEIGHPRQQPSHVHRVAGSVWHERRCAGK